jgi:hypothetical protein
VAPIPNDLIPEQQPALPHTNAVTPSEARNLSSRLASRPILPRSARKSRRPRLLIGTTR